MGKFDDQHRSPFFLRVLTGGSYLGRERMCLAAVGRRDSGMPGTRSPRFWTVVYSILFAGMLLVPQSIMAAAVRDATPPSSNDGPAELPRLYVKSSLADTPAPGNSWLVKTPEDLKHALDEASCGDTIRLQEGTSFGGKFIFPAKKCDDSHWIVVRSNAPDAALPPEGTRLTPCFAGVASLPGRPDFHCSSTSNVVATIAFNGIGGSGPIMFAEGANHYRLIGLEVTRSNPGASVAALISLENDATADHLVFDRIWIHGTAQEETRRGIQLGGSVNVAIVDSYFTDFHCVAVSGTCTDTQAIGGGNGSHPMGPYKIVDNFLEAAGENIIFGGGKATATPADIEIRHNHLFKPMIWMAGVPGFVGGTSGHPFIVKNHFELKNAQRVLFEGNVLEDSWGGFTQTGFSIVLTPKNQSTGKENVCPLCRVSDITIRNCRIAHVGSGFLIANALSPITRGVSSGGERYSIHDVVFDDIDGQKYAGFGSLMVLLSIAPKLTDVRIDHLTAFPPKVLFSLGVKDAKISNFSFTNNLVNAGERQITSAGMGRDNCAFQPERQQATGVLKSCFDGLSFTNNIIIGGSGAWPPGNFLPKNVAAVGFMNSGKVGMSDYRLCRTKDASTSCKAASPYLGAGTDKKDVGADIDAIEAATAGAN
jgi:hypothetical protein